MPVASISHLIHPTPISIHPPLPLLWGRPHATSNSQLPIVYFFPCTYLITFVGVTSSLPSKTLLLELENVVTAVAKSFSPRSLTLSLIHLATPSSRADTKLRVPHCGFSPCAQARKFPQVHLVQYPPLWVLTPIAPMIYPASTPLFNTSMLRQDPQSNQHGSPPSNVATTIPGPASP